MTKGEIMRGHNTYIQWLSVVADGALAGKPGYIELQKIMEETAVFDAGLEKQLPLIPEANAWRERALLQAGSDRITGVDIPKWALVVRDFFIAHLERVTIDGMQGVKARLMLLDDRHINFCPAAVFIPDDWRGFALVPWEMTDRELERTEHLTEVAAVVQCVYRAARRLRSMPAHHVTKNVGKWVGTAQRVAK